MLQRPWSSSVQRPPALPDHTPLPPRLPPPQPQPQPDSRRRGRRCPTARSGASSRVFLSTECEAHTEGAAGWDLRVAARVSAAWDHAAAAGRRRYASESLSAEAFLRQVAAATDTLGVGPNPLRTAACCAVFCRVADETPLLRLLYDELLTAVYDVPRHRGQPPVAASPTMDFHLSHVMWCDKYRSTRESFLYYQGAAEQGGRVLARQQEVLGKAIRTWQMMLVARYVAAWRLTTRRLRQTRVALVLNSYVRRERLRLQTHFVRWRTSSVVDKARRTKSERKALDDKQASAVAALRADNERLAREKEAVAAEKVCAEEELARVRAQLREAAEESSQRAARVATLEGVVAALREAAATLVELVWPACVRPPRALLFPDGNDADADAAKTPPEVQLTEPPSLSSPRRSLGGPRRLGLRAGGADARADRVRANAATLAQQREWLADVAPARLPPVRFLLYVAGHLASMWDASVEPPASLATDLKDGLVYLGAAGAADALRAGPEAAVECGGAGERAAAVRASLKGEMNLLRRCDAVLRHLYAEVFPASYAQHSPVSALHVSEGWMDANFVFLHSMVRQLFLPRRDEEPTAAGRREAGRVRAQASLAEAEEFRAATGAMAASVREWQAHLASADAQSAAILKARFGTKEGSVLQEEGRKKEKEALVSIDALRLQDLFAAHGLTEPAARLHAHEEIRQVLNTHNDLLYSIWKFYSPDGRLMAADKFWRFVSNSKLIAKTMKKTMVAKFFSRANKASNAVADRQRVAASGGLGAALASPNLEGSPRRKSVLLATECEAEGDEEGAADSRAEVLESYNPDDELTGTEWVDCIVHIAYYRCAAAQSATGGTTATIAERVEALIDTTLRASSFQSSVDEFRDQLYRQEVQAVLSKYNKPLQKMFKHYSRLESSLGAASARKAPQGNNFGTDSDMSLLEFKQLLRDARLLDQTLTPEATTELFQFLQEDEEGNEPGKDANQTLVYREFLEVIVCISIYKYPAPYIKLGDRVQLFLAEKLLPNLAQALPKLKLRP